MTFGRVEVRINQGNELGRLGSSKNPLEDAGLVFN